MYALGCVQFKLHQVVFKLCSMGILIASQGLCNLLPGSQGQ